MKKFISLSIFLLAIVSLSIANKPVIVEASIPVLDTIIGYFDLNQLKTEPYNIWFKPEYENYSVDTVTLNQLKTKFSDNLEITIVMGTWCSDSQREVPRFIKILTYLNFDLDQVTAIGVNRKKQAPDTTVDELKIEYVPTIIFYRDNVEIGRIIESPEESLEKDLLKILSVI